MFNKKIGIVSLMVIVLSSTVHVPQTQAAPALDTVQFQISQHSYTNGSGQHSLPVTPFILQDNSMVPLRALAQSLGAAVKWDQANQTVTLTGQPFGQLKMKVNTTVAVNENGEQVELPESIRLVKGNLVVPAKSIASLMGATVEWIPSSHTITISKNIENSDSIHFNYDFNTETEGWEGDFADLPVDYNKDIYELQHTRELLPIDGDNKTNYGLKLKGSNRSDDLFMFLTKKIENLASNTEYHVKLDFSMYTSVAGGSFGIGGAPSESVYVKAAVLNKEPIAVQLDDGGGLYYRMNIDKGNQSMGGEDAKVLGNITKLDSGKEGYQRKNFSYTATVTTNAKGELFLLIGTDSGFEGLTTLYFDDIKLTATEK